MSVDRFDGLGRHSYSDQISGNEPVDRDDTTREAVGSGLDVADMEVVWNDCSESRARKQIAGEKRVEKHDEEKGLRTPSWYEDDGEKALKTVWFYSRAPSRKNATECCARRTPRARVPSIIHNRGMPVHCYRCGRYFHSWNIAAKRALSN